MKYSIVGIFALLAVAGVCAFADGTAVVNVMPTSQAKEIVEEMRGLDMRLGNTMMDDGSPNLKELHKLAIIKELRSIGPDAIPALIQALSDPDDQMRCNADLVFVILGGGYDDVPKMDITKAFPALLKSTGDTNSNARGWAAQAIARWGLVPQMPFPCLPECLMILTWGLVTPPVSLWQILGRRPKTHCPPYKRR